MIDKRECDIMDVMDKLRDLFCDDFEAEENKGGGTSYNVTVKSSTEEVSSHD